MGSVDRSGVGRPSAGQPAALLTSVFNERDGRLSPDGKLLAYVSDETGREEVYLRMLSESAVKLQVSAAGGSKPVWGAAGSRELYFASSDGEVMSVPVAVGPG